MDAPWGPGRGGAGGAVGIVPVRGGGGHVAGALRLVARALRFVSLKDLHSHLYISACSLQSILRHFRFVSHDNQLVQLFFVSVGRHGSFLLFLLSCLSLKWGREKCELSHRNMLLAIRTRLGAHKLAD